MKVVTDLTREEVHALFDRYGSPEHIAKRNAAVAKRYAEDPTYKQKLREAALRQHARAREAKANGTKP